MKVSDLDKNFRFKSEIKEEGLTYYSPLKKPFSIHGVKYENGLYCRISEEISKNVSNGVFYIGKMSAGGRVRFCTDSPYIAIRAEYAAFDNYSHFSMAGYMGLDLFADDIYIGTYIPHYNIKKSFESIIYIPEYCKGKTFTLNMPSYAQLKSLYIGVKKNSLLTECAGYKHSLPIVFYGSSITQGGCASRPGNSYQQILSNRLDFDYINLGFSGSAKGEPIMRRYLSDLDMSIFVFDYDHNAPTPEHLRETHYLTYSEVRSKHPDIPIIMMSRPKKHLNDEEKERKQVVYDSYIKAKDSGDNNVYFIPGDEIFPDDAAQHCLVDNCHPNDLGFYFMADKLYPLLNNLLNGE